MNYNMHAVMRNQPSSKKKRKTGPVYPQQSVSRGRQAGPTYPTQSRPTTGPAYPDPVQTRSTTVPEGRGTAGPAYPTHPSNPQPTKPAAGKSSVTPPTYPGQPPVASKPEPTTTAATHPAAVPAAEPAPKKSIYDDYSLYQQIQTGQIDLDSIDPEAFRRPDLVRRLLDQGRSAQTRRREEETRQSPAPHTPKKAARGLPQPSQPARTLPPTAPPVAQPGRDTTPQPSAPPPAAPAPAPVNVPVAPPKAAPPVDVPTAPPAAKASPAGYDAGAQTSTVQTPTASPPAGDTSQSATYNAGAQSSTTQKKTTTKKLPPSGPANTTDTTTDTADTAVDVPTQPKASPPDTTDVPTQPAPAQKGPAALPPSQPKKAEKPKASTPPVVPTQPAPAVDVPAQPAPAVDVPAQPPKAVEVPAQPPRALPQPTQPARELPQPGQPPEAAITAPAGSGIPQDFINRAIGDYLARNPGSSSADPQLQQQIQSIIDFNTQRGTPERPTFDDYTAASPEVGGDVQAGEGGYPALGADAVSKYMEQGLNPTQIRQVNDYLTANPGESQGANELAQSFSQENAQVAASTGETGAAADVGATGDAGEAGVAPVDAMGGQYTGEMLNGIPVYEHPQGGKYTQTPGSSRMNWVTDFDEAGLTKGSRLEEWERQRGEVATRRSENRNRWAERREREKPTPVNVPGQPPKAVDVPTQPAQSVDVPTQPAQSVNVPGQPPRAKELPPTQPAQATELPQPGGPEARRDQLQPGQPPRMLPPAQLPGGLDTSIPEGKGTAGDIPFFPGQLPGSSRHDFPSGAQPQPATGGRFPSGPQPSINMPSWFPSGPQQPQPWGPQPSGPQPSINMMPSQENMRRIAEAWKARQGGEEGGFQFPGQLPEGGFQFPGQLPSTREMPQPGQPPRAGELPQPGQPPKAMPHPGQPPRAGDPETPVLETMRQIPTDEDQRKAMIEQIRKFREQRGRPPNREEQRSLEEATRQRLLDPESARLGYGQGDVTKALGREAQSGIEAQMATIAEQLNLDADAEVGRQSQVVKDQFQQQREQLGRMFALNPGAEGQMQRRFEQLAGEEARALNQVDASVRAAARDEARANLASLTGLQESRERAALAGTELGLQAAQQAQQFVTAEEELGLKERGIGLEEATVFGEGEGGRQTLGAELGRGQAELAREAQESGQALEQQRQEFTEEMGRQQAGLAEAEMFGGEGGATAASLGVDVSGIQDAAPGSPEAEMGRQQASGQLRQAFNEQFGRDPSDVEMNALLSGGDAGGRQTMAKQQLQQQGSQAQEELRLQGRGQTIAERSDKRRMDLEEKGLALERDRMEQTNEQFNSELGLQAEKMGLEREQVEHAMAISDKAFEQKTYEFEQNFGAQMRQMGLDATQMAENVRLQDEERLSRYGHLGAELGLDAQKFEQAVRQSDEAHTLAVTEASRAYGLDERKTAMAEAQVQNDILLRGMEQEAAIKNAAKQMNLDEDKFREARRQWQMSYNDQEAQMAKEWGVRQEAWKITKRTNERREAQIDDYWSGFMAKGGRNQVLEKGAIIDDMGLRKTADRLNLNHTEMFNRYAPDGFVSSQPGVSPESQVESGSARVLEAIQGGLVGMNDVHIPKDAWTPGEKDYNGQPSQPLTFADGREHLSLNQIRDLQAGRSVDVVVEYDARRTEYREDPVDGYIDSEHFIERKTKRITIPPPPGSEQYRKAIDAEWGDPSSERIKKYLYNKYPTIGDSQVDRIIAGASVEFAVSPHNWFNTFEDKERAEISSFLAGVSYNPPAKGPGFWGQMGNFAGKAAVALAGSDRDIKENIVRVGASPSGLTIYQFNFRDGWGPPGTYRGVISDEIPRHAVMPGAMRGRDMVDYNKIDVDMTRVK